MSPLMKLGKMVEVLSIDEVKRRLDEVRVESVRLTIEKAFDAWTAEKPSRKADVIEFRARLPQDGVSPISARRIR